jgi:hypothetical protein
MSSNPNTQSKSLAERAKSILFKPKEEWPVIAAEPTSSTQVLTGYVMLLALIPPVCSFIGAQLFGYGFMGMNFRPSLGASLTSAVLSYALTLVGVYLVAWLANFLAPKFDGKQNWDRAFKLVAYTGTAAWIVGVFNLVPALSFLTLLGLYGFYLFYTGAGPMMEVPKDKAAIYTIVTVIAAFIVYIIIGAIVGAIVGVGAMAGGMNMSGSDDDFMMEMGDFGRMQVEGENSTIDMGEMGRIEMDGNTATITVDGQEFTTTVEPSE